jgi:elongation factor 3
MTHKGKVPIVDDALFEKLERQGKLSGSNTPRSKAQTPAGSAMATPAASGDEASKVASGTATPDSAAVLIKKKKLTRNQLKAQAERRKARQLHWLRCVFRSPSLRDADKQHSFGGLKPGDTDSD